MKEKSEFGFGEMNLMGNRPKMTGMLCTGRVSEIRGVCSRFRSGIREKVETWRQALKFTMGLSKRNASFPL